jgi:hypothetical protein
MLKTFGAAAAFALALADVALAHHGISNFDLNKDLQLAGTLTKVDLLNPHSWMYLDVKDASGKVSSWRCEMRAATVLKRSGWSQDMFKPGTQITVTGSPERNKPNICYLGTVILADGTSMNRYGQLKKSTPAAPVARAARLPSGVPNLGGDWAAEQRVMTDPRGLSGAFLPLSEAEKLEPGEVPKGQRAFPGARGTPESLAADPVRASWTRPTPVALTEAGKRALVGFDPSSPKHNPRLRCEPTNILFDWTFDTLVNRIIQTDAVITMKYGFMDLERRIHLNVDKHPPNLTPSVTGHSIGRWEGDVLVVDTIGFAPGVLLADSHTLHSDRLHVVERFSLDAKKNAIVRTYVAEDPLYFTGQYQGSDTVYVADLPYESYECAEPGVVKTAR